MSILADLDRRPEWRIEDSLEHQLRLFHHVTGLIGEGGRRPIGIASLLEPEACLRPQAEPLAWAVSTDSQG